MSKHVIGNIGGNDVVFTKDTDMVFCKNTELPYRILRKVFDGSLSRVKIKDDLYYVDHGTKASIGCLEITKEQYKQMVVNIEKIKIKNGERNN
jgi:CRISPR/Cas system-associated protein endoribonuclease Cas2